MNTADVTIIVSDTLKDSLMHAAAIFEPFKILIEEPISLRLNLDENNTLGSLIERARLAINKSKKYRVIAIFCPGLAEGAWCDRDIITISNGRSFSKFYDCLMSMNYKGPMPKRYIDEVA